MIGKALIAIYQPFPIHPKANFHHIPFNPVTLFYLFFIPQLASQKSSQDNLLPDLLPQSHHIIITMADENDPRQRAKRPAQYTGGQGNEFDPKPSYLPHGSQLLYNTT